MAKVPRTTAGSVADQRVVVQQLERQCSEFKAERDDLLTRIRGLVGEIEGLEHKLQPQRETLSWELRTQAALNTRDVAAQRKEIYRAELAAEIKGQRDGRHEERQRQFEEAKRVVPSWVVWLVRHFGQDISFGQGPAWYSYSQNQDAMRAQVASRIKERSWDYKQAS
jgi:hypothetical protein